MTIWTASGGIHVDALLGAWLEDLVRRGDDGGNLDRVPSDDEAEVLAQMKIIFLLEEILSKMGGAASPTDSAAATAGADPGGSVDEGP